MENKEKLLETAKKAAYEAGKIQLSYFGKKKEIERKTSEFDLVTNADKLSEEKIISIIKAQFPKHDFLAEETGFHSTENKSEFLWIIDPLDGTTNYAHNFPHFAVSIALEHKGKIVLGVVLDPFKNEMFWSLKGKGAFLNQNLISVSQTATLHESMLATGFPYFRENALEQNLAYFRAFLYKTQAVRRPGSAALDLCYVAAGRLDGFWELNLSYWDVAAGILIVREAGGKAANFRSEEFNPNVKNILASNNLVHEEMERVIQGCKKTVAL